MTLDEETTPSDVEEIEIATDENSGDDLDEISLADSSLQLEADLAAAKVDIAEWHDRYMRKAAEFENYRKRVEREKADLRVASQGAILRELLPVVDGFDRALQSFEANPDGQASPGHAGSAAQYREGMELLYRLVLDALAQAGATPIETEGREFDPNLHEALSREMTAEVEDGTVVRELRRGYMFKGKLLRPAQVVVAVHPKPSEN